MKILLVSLPFDFPLAAYCLAAQLAAEPATASCEVELLHLDIARLNTYNRKNAETWRYIARLEAARPDVVAFSVYLWNHLACRELIGITKRLFPLLRIVVGGPELADQAAAEPWLEGGRVAAAVRGEGELTFVELLTRWRAGQDLEGVAGCSWWDGRRVVHEAPRPPVRELGRLVSPYLSGWVPDDAFERSDGTPGQFRRAILETYRGCYMQCSYCQWGYGTASRFRFPDERVFGELTWILERHIAELWIVDAMFGFKKRLAKEILRHVIAEKKRLGAETDIACYHNQDFFDPELFDLYREAGVTVEVDLQSTDRQVLERVGRGKWYTDSFDRHLEAFHHQDVPTSGAADLMIGLPRDRLESFEESVDFLLRRGMRVNLYQTSIIPQTPMGRSLGEDGTVHAELAPRPVLENASFPVRDMVAARLLGHGVDLFRLYPKTAQLLWRLGFERPVDLCRSFGQLVWQRRELMFGESHTHDSVLAEEHGLLLELVEELCPDGAAWPALRDLFRLELASARILPLDGPGRRRPPAPILRGEAGDLPAGEAWLQTRPRFRTEALAQVRLEHRIDRLIEWLGMDELPPPESWQLGGPVLVALVHRKGRRHTGYRLVDEAMTHALLCRFTGYFSVAECLESFAGAAWRRLDLAPLFTSLESLARGGFIELGRGTQAGGKLL